MNPSKSDPAAERPDVRRALIEATADLLGEVGPKSLSVRQIADRAGVNHGQIHHYFQGKRGLLEAALRNLAKAHFDDSLERAGGDAIPPPLSLGEDRRYFRALCQAVMDDDLDLIRTVDADHEISVPIRVLRELEARKPDVDPLEVKALFALGAAAELGWVAFEKLILLAAEVDEPDEEAFRKIIKRLMAEKFYTMLG
ncbi:MAG: TetR/AcrR family transcriptional regulator [Myxococcota bacterium]|nr:TetR/AcrR family transcriptional regulator [Myxococcota bacterium]